MRNFILGTDWWTDCDDCVAVRILSRAHKKGQINLLGICANACFENTIESLDVFLQNEGMKDLPLGVDPEGTDFRGIPGSYQNYLVTVGHGRKNADAENGVRLYRRLLAGADGPVDIVEIGFLQVVAGLLLSGPDDLSPLDGVELVREKVAHFWVMAGRWDRDIGYEHNINNNKRSSVAADIFCQKCPVPVTFLGFEIGEPVITGKTLPENDMLKQCMIRYGVPNGRCSWDPMTAELALAGSAMQAGYGEVFGTASVNPEDGGNTFSKSEKGLHSYVVFAKPHEYYADRIEEDIR